MFKVKVRVSVRVVSWLTVSVVVLVVSVSALVVFEQLVLQSTLATDIYNIGARVRAIPERRGLVACSSVFFARERWRREDGGGDTG